MDSRELTAAILDAQRIERRRQSRRAIIGVVLIGLTVMLIVSCAIVTGIAAEIAN